MIYRLRRGIRNLIRWFPIIWRDADWDWEFLARIMETKLRWMADHHERCGVALGRARDIRQMRVCTELLRRMQADEYFVHAGYDPETWNTLSHSRARAIIKHSDAVSAHDGRYLGLLLGKHMRKWWD